MSNNDSFIEEVSEEVRRDQLFRLFRKYGWVAGIVIAALVGGASFNEWRKANVRAGAEALGDAMLAALRVDDAGARAVAFGELLAATDEAPILLNFQSAAAQVLAGDTDAAVVILQAVSADSATDPIYRDLAALKVIMLRGNDTPRAERIATLDRLATVGQPFRLLALEQRAIARLESGDTEQALSDLKAILEDPLTTRELRQRAAQLTVALGGEIPDRTRVENG